MVFIFYSKHALGGHAYERAREVAKMYKDGAELRALESFDLFELFSVVGKDDTVILLGGDGTINHFVNTHSMYPCPKQLLYASGGTGNDFYRDVREHESSDIFPLTPYLQKLPSVQFLDRYLRFINGVGFGIDGYCCKVLQDHRDAGKKPPSYVSVAFRALLYKFKPVSATVTVDGVTHWFHNVYVATTMFGRYYGGGVKIAPDQDRRNDHQVSVVVGHGKSRLALIPVFAKLFKGTHIKHKKHVTVLRGNEITVSFDRACAMQVDGDVFSEISSYTVKAPTPIPKTEEEKAAV